MKHAPYLHFFTLLLTAFALATFTYTVTRYAVNIPFQDDISDSLAVFLKIQHATDFGTAFSAFYEQHLDHRTTATRLVYLIFMGIDDQVNYNHLAIFLLAFLLMFLLVLARSYSRILPACKLSIHAIVFLIFLQPITGMLVLWATGGFAYLGAIAYGFYCLLLLEKPGRAAFIGAMAFACLATFSLRSGQLVWLLALPLLLAQQDARNRKIIAWCCGAALCFLAYYLDFVQDKNALTGLISKSLPIRDYIYFALVLLGSGLAFGSPVIAAAIGGLSLPGLAYLLFMVRGNWKCLPVFCFYTAGLIAAVAYGRASQLPVEAAAQSPRYAFLSLTYLVTLSALLIPKSPRRSALFNYGLLAAALFFNIAGYFHGIDTLKARQNSRIMEYNEDRFWSIAHPGVDVQEIVDEAITAGIYRPDTKPVAPLE